MATVDEQFQWFDAQIQAVEKQVQEASGEEKVELLRGLTQLRRGMAAQEELKLEQLKLEQLKQQSAVAAAISQTEATAGAAATAAAAAADDVAAAVATIQQRLPCASKYASHLCSNGVKEAAVVVHPHYVATYRHAEHSQWSHGQVVQVFVNAGESDEPRCIDGTVVHADQKADLVLLQVPEALKAPPLDAQLSPGQRYFILGQSAQAQPDASSVSHGIIAATQPDACSHVRGDTKAGLGDLGAGCFAVDTGRLIGMIVGVDPNAHKSVLVPGAVIAHALSMVTPAA